MQSVDQFLQTQSASSQPQLQSVDDFLATSKNILPTPTHITQDFATYNPSLEVFSGGVARDTNFATSQDIPVKVPDGQWQVISSYNQASPQGRPGDSENQGYGNAVMVQNKQTGERLHLIHLSSAQVHPGDIIEGGTQVGMTGSSGNATGPNLGIEYYDPQGNLGDVMQSPYAKYLPMEREGGGNKGGGGFGQILGQIGSSIGNFLNSDYQDQTAMAKGDQQSQQAVMKRLPTAPQAVPQHVYMEDNHQSYPLEQVQGLAANVIQAINPQKPSAQAQVDQAMGSTNYEKQAAPIFEKYGIPPAVGLGIWAMEGRGKTINPNNPYNIGAYDSNPQNANAYPFKTPLEGTEEAAKFLAGQSQYMAADKRAIFQRAVANLKQSNDVAQYLKDISPTYSSNPQYAQTVEQTPEYTRWAGGK